ncbi:MAG: hypothetical protein ACE5NM_06480 [Sedimentisphaerales bacterium]
MAVEYSVNVCKELEQRFHRAQLYRPMRVRRYDAGGELTYDVTAVSPRSCLRQEDAGGRVHLIVEKFVGGGFAGQVYKVKVLGIEVSDRPIEGLEIGRSYAMKILVPPSSFSRLFRNFLYWIGFQGPFQLQVNPTAAKAGALWQKFIRRGVKIRFGDESAVVDIYATFVDSTLGSCGELSEWVDGRTWRLEVDDHLDLLSRWRKGRQVDVEKLDSLEYRAKYDFMHKFVELLHDMGAYEFARQYEWSTAKSQPNCLKRRGTEDDPSGGLVAVDFRAGLALLPFLPMSPGDIKLIAKGLMRGSLVQFDRGSVEKLAAFVQEHSDEFTDMRNMLEELKAAEQVYRSSVPDITHNHIRLLGRRLWSTILDSAITGWKVQNLIDKQHEQKLAGSRTLALWFFLIGLIPLLGGFLLKIWGRPDWRRHYVAMLTGSSWDYLQRAVRGSITETTALWYRAGRIGPTEARKMPGDVWRFLCHLPLSVLPAGIHRFLTDKEFRKDKLVYIFVRPLALYFNRERREQWLREMVTEGQKKHILSDEDASIILSQVNEPFIQKYLKSLAVHVCTLPVTQIVSVLVAIIYVLMHPEMPRAQAWGIGLGIIALFQVVPISPGSLARGLYVLYLVIRERNFRDYNIAVFLGFFKYIGYLAFPIQMTYHYPALARFMAAHWATGAVHIVPVFGEQGALLEHWVFRLFYNWPLTIRRRMRRRQEIRAFMEPRYWHVGLCAVVAAGVFGLADVAYRSYMAELPGLKDIWWLIVAVPLVCGTAVTLGCGGAKLGKRISAAAICGVLVGVLYTAVSAMLGHSSANEADNIMAICLWRVFIFTILSAIGAVITELKLPDPDMK